MVGKIDLGNLGSITPTFFENYLIFSLSKDWINKFSGIPEFVVFIDNKRRLCITSIQEIKDDVE